MDVESAEAPHLACWEAASRTTENVSRAVQAGPVHRADLADAQLEVLREPLAGRLRRVLRDRVDECGHGWRRLVGAGAAAIVAVADDGWIRRFDDCLMRR